MSTKDKVPAGTGTEHGLDEAQEKINAEAAQGFRGTTTDPTPDWNYTVPGVASGAPTPETDDDQAVAVLEHQRDLGRVDVAA